MHSELIRKMKLLIAAALCLLLGLLLTLSLIFMTLTEDDDPLKRYSRNNGIRSLKLVDQQHSNDRLMDDGACESYDFYTALNPGRRLTNLTPKIDSSCIQLRLGDKTEMKKARNVQEKWNNSISDESYLRGISNCSKIVPTFNDNFYISDKEKNFPLGFVMLVSYSQHSVQQYIRLLRFIYRPQNVYCIHIDRKSPDHWTKAITTFASCFSNIFVAKDAVEVIYAHASILTAHLKCLEELSYGTLPWKYVIDLHGTELPIVTNREMVEALESLHGTNVIKRGEPLSKINPSSVTYRKMTRKATFIQGLGMKLTRDPLGPVPFNMTLYKSADAPNGAFSREFVHFVLTDARAMALFEYLQDVLSAVEFFFNTLNNLPDAPGGGNEYSNKIRGMPSVVVRHWRDTQSSSYCSESYYRHRICIVSASDLHWLSRASSRQQLFFVNKYLMDYDHIVMDCMEELLLKRNFLEYERDCKLKI